MSYHIVDEPKPTVYQSMIVDPLLIFFAAIFVPLIWDPPYFGRIWLPILWLIINSYLLGSPHFKKEIGIALCALGAWFGIVYLGVIGFDYLGVFAVEKVVPYLLLLSYGVFFLCLYWLVFLQRTPFEIYSYIREQQS